MPDKKNIWSRRVIVNIAIVAVTVIFIAYMLLKGEKHYLPIKLNYKVIVPAQDNARFRPLPVLFEALDISFIPEKRRSDMDKCYFVAYGYGDLSTNRGYFSTKSILCTSKPVPASSKQGNENTVLKGYFQIAGFIVEQVDGNLGIQGKPTYDATGKVLLNSIMEGISNSDKQFNNALDVEAVKYYKSMGNFNIPSMNIEPTANTFLQLTEMPEIIFVK